MAKDQNQGDVTLHCVDKHQHGKKMILPRIGVVEIPADGNFTIDDVTASLLLNHSGHNFKLVKGNGTTVPDTEEIVDSVKETEEATPDNLDELELDQLINLAEEAEYPAKSYAKFLKSKKLMINFLRKNA